MTMMRGEGVDDVGTWYQGGQLFDLGPKFEPTDLNASVLNNRTPFLDVFATDLALGAKDSAAALSYAKSTWSAYRENLA